MDDEKVNMPEWLQRVVLGNSDAELGATVIRQLAVWVKMSRVKHIWEREVQGEDAVVIAALQSELDELRNAIKRNDPKEHVICEILDFITVALRYLCGEHLLFADERTRWQTVLENVKPTKPGGVSQYDEHKGENMSHDYGMRCEKCGRHLCLDESANGGLCHSCLEKAALEDEEKRPKGEIYSCDRCGKEYVKTSNVCLCPDCDAILEEACRRDCTTFEVEEEWRKQGKLKGNIITAKPEITTDEAVDLVADFMEKPDAWDNAMQALKENLVTVHRQYTALKKLRENETFGELVARYGGDEQAAVDAMLRGDKERDMNELDTLLRKFGKSDDKSQELTDDEIEALKEYFSYKDNSATKKNNADAPNDNEAKPDLELVKKQWKNENKSQKDFNSWLKENKCVVGSKAELNSNGQYIVSQDNLIDVERGTTLLKALKVINGDRKERHGKPEDCFASIAALWNGYLDALAKALDPDPELYPLTYPTLLPQHVAQMMALMKVARTLHGAAVQDSHIDGVAYLALAADLEKNSRTL